MSNSTELEVDRYFPYDPELPLKRDDGSSRRLPELLRVISHRPTAQLLWKQFEEDHPLLARPTRAADQPNDNPQHWQDR